MPPRPRKHSKSASLETDLMKPASKRICRTAGVYVYDVLKSDNSMRIFELLPGKREDLIRCRLFTTERLQAPPYAAISYAWGKPSDLRVITCNDKVLKVPTNLRDVLYQIRNPQESRYLWADSICINQSDLRERGHQVRLMHSIYSSAQKVIVWLGSDTAFDYFGDPSDLSLSTLVKRFIGDKASLTDRGFVPGLEDIDEDTEMFWQALGRLSAAPWFERLWVIQEAGLGRSVLALVGGMEVDFDCLMEYFDLAFSHSDGVFAARFGLSDTVGLFSLFPSRMHYNTHSEPPDFLDLLVATRHQLASSPHDYIYALLGHPSAIRPGGFIVTPNYDLPPSQIFHQVAMRLIPETRSLRVLSAVSYIDETDFENTHPTWVPQWTRDNKSDFYETNIGAESTFKDLFDASAGTSSSWEFVQSGTVLRVRGFVFDEIEEHTTIIKPKGKGTMGRVHLTALPIAAVFQFEGWLRPPLKNRFGELASAFTQGLHIHPDEDYLRADFAALRLDMWENQTSGNQPYDRDLLIPEGLDEAKSAAETARGERFLMDAGRATGKRIFSTASGMLGSGPRVLRPGDLCCVFFGHPVPMLLRRFGRGYKLVGPAYIHAVMNGEAMVDFIIGEKFPECVFEIV